jgi:hypothetical protein
MGTQTPPLELECIFKNCKETILMKRLDVHGKIGNVHPVQLSSTLGL